ncbi:hypothetical protein C1I98_34915 [Spongiactinospora gelatinilytica]|uniref:Uncharacterized protein n=1 Tax=Spongiactinospora gelatinilytica TaxID=2666298 RepID=A0A2W2FT72_9ACTN|nr:hypothetical protein [Spongiactinospora gelatinilytica]PZG25117.1 hypothetical protein C1I98_34915 [Spongiactinospora gelatinilytica]
MLEIADPYTLPKLKSIVGSIRGHETGRHHPSADVYRPLYARIIVTTIELVVHQITAAHDSTEQPIARARFEDELVAMFTRYLTAAPPAMNGTSAHGTLTV